MAKSENTPGNLFVGIAFDWAATPEEGIKIVTQYKTSFTKIVVPLHTNRELRDQGDKSNFS